LLSNPAERFTGRVESYRRFRPGYPAEIVDLLRRGCELTADSLIADIAAGTGLLAEVFLAAGFSVTAVEPNEEMRAACAVLQGKFPKLRMTPGTAESTGLPSHLSTSSRLPRRCTGSIWSEHGQNSLAS
jgi:hypothetical protein